LANATEGCNTGLNKSSIDLDTTYKNKEPGWKSKKDWKYINFSQVIKHIVFTEISYCGK